MSPVRALVGLDADAISASRWEQFEDSDRCSLCGWSFSVFSLNLAMHREIVKKAKAEHESVCPSPTPLDNPGITTRAVARFPQNTPRWRLE